MRCFKRIMPIITLTIVFVFFAALHVHAKTTTESVQGKKYEYEKSNGYTISEKASFIKIGQSGTNYGVFSFDGDVTKIKDVKDGIVSYKVNSGNVTLNYSINKGFFEESNTKRHVSYDKTKKINGEKFNSQIGTGAILLQTSFDGEKWFTDDSYFDIGNAETDYEGKIGVSHNIQQVKGCYFRVLVAYETTQVEGKKEKKIEYLESYCFYLIDDENNAKDYASPDAEPKYNLGEKEAKKKNAGYTETKEIKEGDPHFGWDIGQFYVNGFSDKVIDPETQNPVFLKNVGDRVVLWFRLDEDIDCLHGDKDLSIMEDKKGYDQEFEVERFNMGRGTLLIRVTGIEGKDSNKDPVIYKNYLAASAHTGAATEVELFEEGDYEVVLDYKIKKKGPAITYTTYDYQISFDFSVRNGNCMVYPMDLKTGSELKDKSIVSDGFYIDMAKSKYLDINVTRSVLTKNNSGMLTEDVRSNAPAKDGEKYDKEGIYTIEAFNQYTNQKTTKVLYVGDNKYYHALAANGITVDELNNEILADATIDDSGTIFKDGEKVTYQEPSNDDIEIDSQKSKDEEAVNDPSEPDSTGIKALLKKPYFIYIAGAGAVVLVVIVIVIILSSCRSKTKKQMKTESQSEDVQEGE